MSAPIRFYIDLTPEARHCPAHWRLSDTRKILLCDDCALPIRHELSLDYANEATHARTQHLLCAKCNRNGFGEPATRTDLTVMDVVGEEPSGDLESDLAEARAEAKRFEAQWELALHEIAELKAERDALRNRWQSTDVLDAIDGVLDLAYDQQAEIELVWAGRREQWRKGIAADIATVRKVLDEQRALSNPDPASPDLAGRAEASTTESGEVDEVAAAAIELYRAGDIGGAQRLILEDLIAQERRKSQKRGEASTTLSGEVDDTTGPGGAAGDGADGQ